MRGNRHPTARQHRHGHGCLPKVPQADTPSPASAGVYICACVLCVSVTTGDWISNEFDIQPIDREVVGRCSGGLDRLSLPHGHCTVRDARLSQKSARSPNWSYGWQSGQNRAKICSVFPALYSFTQTPTKGEVLMIVET